ncbi:MAG: hypothetical protein AB1472_02340 [Candidatus Omnitrophota bacterium]
MPNAIKATVSWKKQLAMEHQKIKETEEKYKLEDIKILKAFESNKTVFVKFYITQLFDAETRKKFSDADLRMRKIMNREYVINNIINPIGINDILSYEMENNSIACVVEVTRVGYEKLKKNKHAKWIALWHKVTSYRNN